MARKTRHQVAQLEKEGVPVTPPQQLNTTTRPKRNTRSNIIRADSSEPESYPPSATITSTRGGRVSKPSQAQKPAKPKAAKKKKKGNAGRAASPILEEPAAQREQPARNEAASEVSNGSETQGDAMDDDDKEDTPRPREAPNVHEAPVVAQPVQVPRGMTLRSSSLKPSVPTCEESPLGSQPASAPPSASANMRTQLPVPACSATPALATSNRPFSTTATLYKGAAESIQKKFPPKCPRVSLHDTSTYCPLPDTLQEPKAKMTTADHTLLSRSGSGAHTEVFQPPVAPTAGIAIRSSTETLTEDVEQPVAPTPNVVSQCNSNDAQKVVPKPSLAATPTVTVPSSSDTHAGVAEHTEAPTLDVATGLVTSSGTRNGKSAPKQPQSPLHMPVTSMRYPIRFIYNFPQRGNEKLHTIVTFRLDTELAQQVRKLDLPHQPPRECSLAIAIPSSMLPDLLTFIADHPDARNSALPNLTSEDLVAKMVVSELTKDATTGTVLSQQNPLADSSGNVSNPLEQATKPRSPVDDEHGETNHNLRGNFGAAKAREIRERQALHEGNAQAQGSDQHLSSENSIPPSKTVTQWYDEKGNLTLGMVKEVPIELAREESYDEEMSEEDTDMVDRMDETEHLPDEDAVHEPQNDRQAAPDTPRNRGWGLGRFLPSAARSVSRFIPGFGRRAVLAPQQRRQAQRRSPTEFRPHVSATQGRSAGVTAAGGLASRSDSTKKILLTKGQAAARRKTKEEKKWYEEQLERMRQEDARKEDLIKQLQAKANQTARGATETNPLGMRRRGKKRKRRSSPDVIPNPKGASYGMDLDYFVFSSDEDTESEGSNPPSSKRKRVSTSDREGFVDPFNANPHKTLPGDRPSGEVIGDPHRARPYTGTLFAMPGTPKQHQGGNIFSEQTLAEKAASPDQTPKPQQPHTFRVPSPGSSDDEYEYDESYVGPTVTPTKDSSGPSFPAPSPTQASSETLTRSPSPPKSTAAAPANISKTQTFAPASRPVEKASASLPPNLPSASEMSLNIQRNRALKYAAKTPSRLQQSSRLSTSTVASEVQESDQPTAAQEANEEPLSSKATSETSEEPKINYLMSYHEQQESATERVVELIERAWDETDRVTAGQVFEEELEAFIEQENNSSVTSRTSDQEQQQSSTPASQATTETPNAVNPRVQSFIDSNWTNADATIAADNFANEFETFEESRNRNANPMIEG